MNFFNFPIKRPVTIVMGMFMILLLGGISLQKMPLNLMPEISFPNLMVFVTYEGAGPEEVEERVAKILEGSIKAAANIKNVKVTAQEELCLINAEFNWGTNLDEASADLRDKISLVRDFLPDGIGEPMIIRINIQEMPVLFLHVKDETKTRNLADLADIAKDEVAPQIERLPGVASAITMGGLTREIQINCDMNKLEQYKLSFTDVLNAIRYRNLDMTTGHVDLGPMRFRIKGLSEFKSLAEIEDIVVGYGLTTADRSAIGMRALIPYKDNLAGQGATSPIRVRDVAEVLDTFKEKKGMVRIMLAGGEANEGIGMAVMKETDANMVEVAQAVIKQLDKIQKTLPAGVQVHISFDLSSIITDSISALTNSAIEGGILAMLVIFVFLWHLRASLIIMTSIPLSMLFAFVIMYFSDYTLNIMTLGGMVIAVGKLVDDSIVVLDNIIRHLQMGKHPHVAAEDGFREVVIAVTAATLVAVIIFLPLGFTQGLSAQLFRSFAATIFFALMASLIVSFTVIPMLTSRLLYVIDENEIKVRKGLWAPFARMFFFFRRGHERAWNAVETTYFYILRWTIDNWGKTMLLTVVVMALTAAFTFDMVARGKYEFVPQLVGNMYRATVKLPAGTLIPETDRLMKDITQRMVEDVPDLKSLFMVIGESGDAARSAFQGGEQGMNKGEMNIMMYKQAEREALKKKGKPVRKSTEAEIRAIWDKFALERPSVEVSFMKAGSLNFSSEKPIIIKVSGADFGVLKNISDDIAERVKTVPGTRDVTTSMQEGVPEYNYSFNTDRLNSYLMPSGMVLNEVQTALGGNLSTLYREAGKEYDITVQVKEEQRKEFQNVSNLKITTPMGFTVPLRDLATFKFDEGPVMIRRENSRRIVTVESNKTEEVSLGQLTQAIQVAIADYPLPEGYFLDFGGEIEDLRDAFTDLALMFVASLILVYLILASLYESLIHPITIMVAIPLAFTGAIGALYFTDTAFGVTAFIGMIMLVGIVANNSIVLIDFLLEYHHGHNMPRREAILEAGKNRLRPILMTALTTLFGVVPIALGRAEGMELQQPLGIVMVGGLISSTILTLVIIPAVYQIMDDFVLDMNKLFRRKSAAPPPAPTPPAASAPNAPAP